MNILDRYLIRQFLVNYVVVLVVLLALFVLVDTIVDLDEFMKAGRVLAGRHGGVALLWSLWAVADWYVPWALVIYAYLSGLVAVAAMGFTFANLNRTRELVAMVSGGISLHRVAAPVLVIGCVLNVLALPVQELIVPRIAQKLVRVKADVGKQSVRTRGVRYMPDGRGNLFSAAAYDRATQTLQGLTVLTRDERGRVTQRITAQSARWDESRHGWDLPGGNRVRPRLGAGDRPGAAGQVEPIEFLPSDLTPKLILSRQAGHYPLLLSLAELREMAETTGQRAAEVGAFSQIIHSRFSLMVVNILIMVMGLPFFLTCAPTNIMAAAIKAAALCLGSWSFGLMLIFTGATLLNPVTAAWLPVVVYLPVGATLLLAVRT